MKPSGLICLLLLFLSLPLRADCDCIWRGSFTDVQQETDLVVAAKVVNSKGNSVDFETSSILRGVEYQNTVRVWMNPGTLCRPEASEFDAGSEWVLALDRIGELNPGDFNPSTPNISVGRVGDYSLSKCGGYRLKLTNDLVTGNLVSATRWDHNPKMSPVLLSLVSAFVAGRIDAQTLKQASEIDPVLQQLQIETRLHLRQENRRQPLD